jgi:hypothetical protein
VGATPRADTLGDARIRVVYEPGDKGRAQRLYRQASRIAPLPALPHGLPTVATIVLAADEASFLEQAGGAVPEWGAAVAIPSKQLIIVPGYPSNRSRGFEEARVLVHEWAHLGLHEYLKGKGVPRWFSEGYADWAAAGWDSSRGWRLRVAIARHQAPSLDSLSLSWPARRGEAEIAYLLSASAIEYLVAESGVTGLEQLLETWAAEGSFEAAFRSTYGLTSGQFEEDWRVFVKRRYGWLLVLSESLVFWALFGAVLTILWWVRRRRSKEQMARLRATEPPPTPDFWNQGVGANPEPGSGYLTRRWSGADTDPAGRRLSDSPDRDGRTAAEDPQE